MDSASITSNTSKPSYFDSLLRRRQQKKMSITQTYYLAHTARKKLTREASRADHDLRLLVGHANLLDSLMYDLADAEREQERWFNQTVSGATKASASASSSRQHIQWASTVVEEPEEDWDAEDASDLDSELSDSDDSDYDESEFVINTPRRRAPSPVAPLQDDLLEEEEDDDDDDTDSDFEYDDAEDLEELSLTRSPSRQSPPELLSDSDGESEDEATPPSPPQPTLEAFDEKEPATTAIALAGSDQPHLFEQGYFGAQEQTLIEAY
ncbi:unnamed protein product [Penicillium nalgiovense]|uniref:Uncharacterized protein n=1 Tax=Penicillium nalgiovense TaxID=60175 RepID=A0A9W4MVR4_PENNA|nr:unnamed protein product [Penicillium nalgiovense]CAG8002552.1 unnamed protein product [Penicillium nalgiovense]CAG8003088.1 unnamed protein product [Penicillium nalgiovense]CAG8035427.1 unnamed protein product [Penicillium nalgiovense]CAG8051376.1 unnamed protein product [Penicillium nalgiovense]